MGNEETLQSSEDGLSNESDGFKVLMEYLQSDKGHQLASRIVGLIEEVKKATLDKNVDQSKLRIEMDQRHRKNLLILQGIVFVTAIIAASTLTYVGKFDPTIGFFFGTLVGYFFGRRPNSQN